MHHRPLLCHFERCKVSLTIPIDRIRGTPRFRKSRSPSLTHQVSLSKSHSASLTHTPFALSQAVHRAYRYGQCREVWVYRLISEGLEDKIYRKQVVKLQLSGRVLDDLTHDSHFTLNELKDFWSPLAPSKGEGFCTGAMVNPLHTHPLPPYPQPRAYPPLARPRPLPPPLLPLPPS